MAYVNRAAVGLFAAAIAVSFAASASAAPQKVSFAKAWALCKAELDKEKVPMTEGSNERYLRGGACLAKYGYKF